MADGVTISPTDWEVEAKFTEGDVAFRGVDVSPEGFVERLFLLCVILAMESGGRVGFGCSSINIAKHSLLDPGRKTVIYLPELANEPKEDGCCVAPAACPWLWL